MTFVTIFLAISVALSTISVICAVYALFRAENPRLIAAESAVRDMEVEVAGLVNAYNSLKETLKRINSRYAMREKRAKDKAADSGDFPDPNTDPEAWRNAVQTRYPRGVFSINGK